MTNVIVTWVYCPPTGSKYVHSQTGADSDTAEVQALYWRCAASLFASSSAVHNPAGTRHLLFSNVEPPARIFGVDLRAMLRENRVEVCLLEKVTCTPMDYYEAWNTQFIVLDLLRHLEGRVDEKDAVLVLDSDCIFRRAISPSARARLANEKALLYTINYGRNYVVNGLSPDQMASIEHQIEGCDLRPDEPFLYHGGELVCLRGDQLAVVEAQGRRVLAACLERHQKRKIKYNEEAHLLSHVYRKLGYPSFGANEEKLIRRLWTDRSITRNIQGNEDELTIWHLPSEKRVGVKRFFRSHTKILQRDYSSIFRFKESYSDIAQGVGKSLLKPLLRYLMPKGSS